MISYAPTSDKFHSTFGLMWLATICADNGFGANIIDMDAIKAMESANVECDVQTLIRPRPFDKVAYHRGREPSILICDRISVIDVELHIRHGTDLHKVVHLV